MGGRGVFVCVCVCGGGGVQDLSWACRQVYVVLNITERKRFRPQMNMANSSFCRWIVSGLC